MNDATKEERFHHNTAMLLKIYRGVLWHAKHRLNEISDECIDLGYDDIRQAIVTLSIGIDQQMPLPKLEDMVFSMRMTSRLIHIVDTALVALKDYPEHGERYFDIINKMYIIQYKYSESEIMDSLNISRRTLYREKKKAVTLLGAILWGFMQPEIIESFGPFLGSSKSGTENLALNWHGNATDNDTLT